MSIRRISSFFMIGFLILYAFPGNVERGKADPGQKGPFEVGHTYFTTADPARESRPIAVYIWYPVDPSTITPASPQAVYELDPYFDIWPTSVSEDWEPYGIDRAYQEPAPSGARPFPLVMFSPGWGCPAWFNLFHAARLASHGFVVAVLHHYSDWCLPWEPFDHVAVACVNRPLDVSFALTKILQRNATPGDLLFNAVAPDRIAASGHSLGGFASMALAAGVDNVGDFCSQSPWIDFFGPPPPETFVALSSDPRIRAILPLDGSNQVMTFKELARIKIPALGVGQEWGTLAAAPLFEGFESWQARQHAAFQGQPSYRIDIAYAFHMDFSNAWQATHVLHDLGLLSDTNNYDGLYYEDWLAWFSNPQVAIEEVNRLEAKYGIAFLKTAIADENGYQDILTPGYALTRELLTEFFVTEKRNPKAVDEDWPGAYLYFKHQSGSEQAKAEKDPKGMWPIQHSRIWR